MSPSWPCCLTNAIVCLRLAVFAWLKADSFITLWIVVSNYWRNVIRNARKSTQFWNVYVVHVSMTMTGNSWVASQVCTCFFFLFPRSSIYLYLFANRIEQMVGMYGNEQSPWVSNQGLEVGGRHRWLRTYSNTAYARSDRIFKQSMFSNVCMYIFHLN